MFQVFWRTLLAGVIAAGVVLAAGVASAATPEGPRLAFVRLSAKPTGLELITSDSTGLGRQKIGGGTRRIRPLPFLLDAPSCSPDGTEIALSAWPRKIAIVGSPETKIYVVAADGTGLRQVPGTTGGLGPVFAPDGHTIAFARNRERTRRTPDGGERTVYSSATTWLADLNGAAPRRLTPWRNRLSEIPTSFSPDGSTLVLARDRGRPFAELISIRLDGSGSVLLARDATDGVYSPDGSKIAFSRVREFTSTRRMRHGSVTTRGTVGDLFVMNADGSEPKRLTDPPFGFQIWPSWDPSGQRLSYARLHVRSPTGIFGFGDAVVEINADGTCRRTVLSSYRLAFYGPSWQ